MQLTRDYNESMREKLEGNPELARLLLDEAATLFLTGESEAARLILRELVNATIGFEQLAEATNKPSKSLHRMLSAKGNPRMDNLTAIFNLLREQLGMTVKVTHEVRAA